MIVLLIAIAAGNPRSLSMLYVLVLAAQRLMAVLLILVLVGVLVLLIGSLFGIR
jgi:hypothetical protein